MTEEITVTGMTCQGCEAVVEMALEMIDGVESADADRYEDRAVVDTAETVDVTAEELASKVELAGYSSPA